MNAEIKIGKNPEGRVTVSFPYNPDYISKVKTIEGYRWHPKEKYWSFLFNGDILEKLASMFEGEKLDISPSLQIRDFEDLRRELISRKYSQKTIRAYLYYNKDFLRFVKKNPAEVTNEDVGGLPVLSHRTKRVFCIDFKYGNQCAEFLLRRNFKEKLCLRY